MSQAEFGSSPEEMSMPPQQLSQQAQQFDRSGLSEPINDISTCDITEGADLQQELLACHRGREQAQVLLHQTQEKLELAQQLIQRQDALNSSLQEHIARLEQDLQSKNEQLAQSHIDCDDLRGRLKRQQHHTSQLKAALERCLDSPTANDSAKFEIPMVESWAVGKLTNEPMINCSELTQESNHPNLNAPTLQTSLTYESVEESLQKHSATNDLVSNVVRMMPIAQSKVETSASSQEGEVLETNDNTDSLSDLEPKLPPFEHPSSSSNSNFHQSHYPPSLLLPQVDTPHFIQVLSEPVTSSPSANEPAPLISSGVGSTRKSITSLAAVKLPQFPPLRR